MQWNLAKKNPKAARFHDAATFLAYAHELGAGGVQVAIGAPEVAYTRDLRKNTEAWGMYLEAQTSLPFTDADVARFEREVRSAVEAGAMIMRTAMLGGRRYETFRSAADFRTFADSAWKALTRAEPILRKHRIRLAIENHKDWRISELLEIVRRISSEHVGICIDLGNSIALLEDYIETVKAFAPFAASTHIKDMAVADYESGFLLAEVPLGEGFLDLKALVEIVTRANPTIQWNLEMITRDPLRVPCLTETYWATLQEVPARDLSLTVGLLREKGKPLPTISHLSEETQRKLEDDNVRRSLSFASRTLGL
jgi:sugar phosphate isomerase/epimerase